MLFFKRDIGLDLGTSSVLVFIKGKGIVLCEPSVVSLDKNTGKLLKVGTDAQKMLGRTPENIITIRPLHEGVISDYKITEQMIRKFLHKVIRFNFIKPRIVICVPSGITKVEEHAILDAGMQAGAGKVYLIEEPIAAAIGAGIDIAKPNGHMIVDIGGGTTDIAVISLGGIVKSASIKTAGDAFDSAVIKYIRRKYNVAIGERTAEELKMNIGCVFPPPEEKSMKVKGRCLMTGLPKSFTITSLEMLEAFKEVTVRIVEAICLVFESTPPELVADIYTSGIIMTGGGSLVWGFNKLIEDKTGIMTKMANDAISSVAYGTGKILETLDKMQHNTIHLSRKNKRKYK
ncbi:MAG: rod shape-determining protein [Dehalobacterium sp.]